VAGEDHKDFEQTGDTGVKAAGSQASGPVCAICRAQSCEHAPAEDLAQGAAGGSSPVPAAKKRPSFCPMLTEPELLAEVAQGYGDDPLVGRLALESARTEAAGYCRLTRVEEIMDFARRMGWRHLGIAHCIGLIEEARTARTIFKAGGFEVSTVCCKVGSVDKEQVGLADEEKVHPGEFEVLCNPVAQAALLEQAGVELNVMLGLCVGHDSLFFMHSHVPTTVLVVKDRVLGHNPVAALYTSHSYYRRLTAEAGQSSEGSGET